MLIENVDYVYSLSHIIHEEQTEFFYTVEHSIESSEVVERGYWVYSVEAITHYISII